MGAVYLGPIELPMTIDYRRGKRAQIERQLREAIQSGSLRADARLPASRVLAADLGVARGTVLDAYQELIAEGYLVGHRGADTRVSSSVQIAGRHDPLPV